MGKISKNKIKKTGGWTVLVIVALLGIAGYQKGWFDTDIPSASASYAIDREEQIVYTRHARCRMGCRHINDKEIKEIIADGKINPGKSDPHDRPCPTYALEGYSYQHQHIRVIVATCQNELKVVTCIDLDKDWPCHCN